MKHRYFYLLAVLGLLVVAGCSRTPTANQNDVPSTKIAAVQITAEHAADQVVVRYDDQEALDSLLQELGGGKVLDTIALAQAALIELPDGLDAAHALGKISSLRIPGISMAQPNYLHPLPQPVNNPAVLSTQNVSDPLEPQKWDHVIMQAADAWSTDMDGAGTTPDGSGVVIAVVDTGIDGLHPDLYGSFVTGYDASGCLELNDNIIPPNFDATYPGEIHGTHVAGIAAARGNNGQGVAGIAYRARIMDLKVFCGGATDDWTIADAILAAITDYDGDGVIPDVITMSLGGKGYGWIAKFAIDLALQYNVVFTIAMGNSFQDEVEYPAGYPGVIAVGASNARDEKTDFSTSGSHISVVAPGEDILSTWPTWDYNASGKPYLYYRISGTSMATPEVAGAAALVKQFLPFATAYEVKHLIEATADDIGPPGYDFGTGYGRVNLKKLMDKVRDILAGNAPLEQGGSAVVYVTTLNNFDADGDGTITSAGDSPVPLEAVDVSLFKDGRLAYSAKTDFNGTAMFIGVAPGTYDVLIAGQDTSDFASWDYWPFERISWDADGDPSNGINMGSLTINPGPNNNLANPDFYGAYLNSTMKVTLEWTGGGDLDLAVYEFSPAAGTGIWSTAKTGGLWGTFSANDAGRDPNRAIETYTLNDVHLPTPAGDYYVYSIDASNAAAGSTATLTLEMNGKRFSFGPIPITPGTTAEDNMWYIYMSLFRGLVNFDNLPCVY